jgi:hypothetical protein
MAGTLLPAPFTYFTDDEGAPLVGGHVYTYLSGTDTPAPVYQDASLSTEWDNPLEIPADGKVTMYQDANTLKMKVYDADDNLLATYDPIQSTSVNSTSAGSAFTFGGEPSYPITVTALPSGTSAATIHPGTSFFTIDSADLLGDYVFQGMLQAGTGETVTASLVNLSQGSPDTPIESITSTSTAGELQTSAVITFAAGGTPRTYAIKTKTATGVASYAYGFALMRSV